MNKYKEIREQLISKIEDFEKRLTKEAMTKIDILEMQDDNFKVTIAKKAKLFWIIPINIKDKLAFDNNTTTLTYNKSWLWIFSKEI